MRVAFAFLTILLTLALDVTPAVALLAEDRPPKVERQQPVGQPYLELMLKDFMVDRAETEEKGALRNGDRLKNPISLVFFAHGVKIAPAGDDTPGTGHFHLLIDSALTPEEMKTAIPADAQHIHYGKGQTEATLTLPPGKHTLQLLLGDGNHVPHDPPIMSQPITVTVE